MKENETSISSEYPSNSTNLKDRNKMSKETDELYISIRRVGMEDHLSIVKLFQVIKWSKVYLRYLQNSWWGISCKIFMNLWNYDVFQRLRSILDTLD